MNDFKIQLPELKRRSKEDSQADANKVDAIGDQHGFIDRSPKKKRGRDKSERTGQVHAKVLPEISDDIKREHLRRGVTQGVLIEEAWELYRQKHGRK